MNKYWLVAQLAEYPAFNRGVLGSKPSGPTIDNLFELGL